MSQLNNHIAPGAIEAAETIHLLTDRLVDRSSDQIWLNNPEFADRFKEAGKERCREDVRYHLLHLTEAVRTDSQILFNKYLEWSQSVLENLHIDVGDLDESLGIIESLIAQEEVEAPVKERILSTLQAGRTHLKAYSAMEEVTFLPRDGEHAQLARNYLELLLAFKRKESCKLILEAVSRGVSLRDIYLEVFQPVQHEVGYLWQINQISVATEHYCTATTQWVMSQLYPMILSDSEPKYRMIAASVSGELHEIGIRMVADLFEIEGWDAMYLGANMPIPGMMTAIEEFEPHLLAFSVTLPYHVAVLHNLITEIRRQYSVDELPILVGGIPFNQDEDLWRRIGAQGSARDGEQAVHAALDLLEPSLGA